MRKTEWEMPADVAAVYLEIEEWRTKRTKRTAIPIGIWSSAVELANRYNVYRISRALRLNYEALKRRLAESSPKPDTLTLGVRPRQRTIFALNSPPGTPNQRRLRGSLASCNEPRPGSKADISR